MMVACILGWVGAAVLGVWGAHEYRLRRKVQLELSRVEAELLQRDWAPATVSHEIRTPLALVKGAAELLAEQLPGKLNDVQRRFVETITENTQQVIDIAESFLIDVRLAGSEPLTVGTVDVRAVVAEAARGMRRIASAPIHVDAEGGMRPIQGDAGLIRQLVWNLVNNAVRHSPEGGVVTVRVADAEESGALITVMDSGEGMSAEDRKNLFAPFVTGSARRVGTGIGMSVAKRIVDAHGGQIMVDSAPGKGTMVHVLMPGVSCSR
ncbi:sensor histidine kinase KdpD [uncultured Tessaracoccus sp.]|uniref:sensor histidine kinase n=1 Tax=uncultured Tessaracoccus sp. TaxID=905023 RepID=UPI00260E5921|nr:HAMP domain-containing sensor histidine kinase [uncultured Tessaracoccus sp.]